MRRERTVLVLGGGVGRVVAATRLRQLLPPGDRVVLNVAPHRAPPVVREAALVNETGWVPVDRGKARWGTRIQAALLVPLALWLATCGPNEPRRSTDGQQGGPGSATRGAASDTPPGGMEAMMGMMMSSLPAGIPSSELPDPESRGARLLTRYCSQCHGIPSPASHSATDWDPTVRRMFARMEHMAHMSRMMGGRMPMMRMPAVAAPTAEEERGILEYLQAHALRAIPEERLPEAGNEGAPVFARTCSRCHALPDPGQHTAAEWPGVVARMRENMRAMGVEEITDAQARAIIGYLQRVAEGQGTREPEPDH